MPERPAFDWDPAKDLANIAKHEVSFDEATTVFGDPLAKILHDRMHSDDEERWVILGMSSRGRLLLVSFRDDDTTTRIISARPPSRLQVLAYERDR